MCGIARRFEGKDKAVWRLLAPARAYLRLLRGVEGSIDLERTEPARGEFKLAPVHQIRRIEHTTPRLIGPTADADADHGPILIAARADDRDGCARGWPSLLPRSWLPARGCHAPAPLRMLPT